MRSYSLTYVEEVDVTNHHLHGRPTTFVKKKLLVNSALYIQQLPASLIAQTDLALDHR